MPKTAVADVIIPTEFERYVIERTAELASFYQSGIVEASEAFDELAQVGGREVQFNDRRSRFPETLSGD